MHAANPDGRPIAGITGRLLLLLGFVALTFPSTFGAMGGGVDGSWVIGLTAAVERHLVHGRDIAFTCGPLGFVLTPLDTGSNLLHAALFRLGLHVLWWTSIGVLLFRIPGRAS